VNWDDAQAFCRWLSEKEGKTYRLPTDREWSLAVGIGREEDWKSDTTPETVFKPPDVFPWGTNGRRRRARGTTATRAATPRLPAKMPYIEGYDDGFPTTAPVMSFRGEQARPVSTLGATCGSGARIGIQVNKRSGCGGAVRGISTGVALCSRRVVLVITPALGAATSAFVLS
jgi:hypothetical protein